MLDAESVLFPVTMISSDDVIPAALKVPVMSAGPPTTRLAVASKLDTEIVCGSLLLLSVPEVMFDAFNVLIPAPEPIILDALKVPVMSAGPPTTKLAVASKLETDIVLGSLLLLSVPEVMFDAFNVLIPAPEPIILDALKVPVISVGPVTKRFDVLRLDAESVLFPVTVMSSDDVIPAVLKVPVMSAGPVTKRLDVLRLDAESVLFPVTVMS